MIFIMIALQPNNNSLLVFLTPVSVINSYLKIRGLLKNSVGSKGKKVGVIPSIK